MNTRHTKRTAGLLVLAMIAGLLTTLGLAGSAAAVPQSDLVIAGGKTAQANSHLGFATHDAKTFLENTANFGPSGTVVVDSLTVTASASTIDAAYLDGVHIYYDAWIWDEGGVDVPQWTTAEITAIDTWVNAGGVLILNEDFGTADQLAMNFGLTFGDATEDGTYTQVNASHPIVNGPFGSWTTQTTCGLSGQFGALGAPWEVVANDDAGNAAIAVAAEGDGWIIVTGDEGLFRNDGACVADTTFIGNVFAYAHSLTDDGNTALSLTDPGDQTSTVGEDIGTLQLMTSGGDASPITFSDSLGPLPAGLMLDTGTGAITGAASGTGTTSVTITATDNTGSSSVTFDWVVNPVDLMPVAAADEGAGTVGQQFSLDLCDNDTLGDGVNTASVSSGTVPDGLAVTNCSVSGTPTTAGNSQFSYILTDADGDMSAPATVDLVITAAADPVTCNGLEVTIPGTEGDDVIIGTSGPDVIHGLGGNDEIHGMEGDDVICGGSGNDELRGNAGSDSIFGNSGTDTIFGNGGADIILGGKGGDTIFGNNGGDTITGNGGADVISGGKKADTIFGNNGTDTISGGSGGDTISGGKKADTIFGNNGNDTLSGGGGGDTIAGGKKNDVISGNGGTDTCSGGGGVNIVNSCEL